MTEFDFGLGKVAKGKKSKNPFEVGIGFGTGIYGASSKKEKERDSRRKFTRTQEDEILRHQNYKCVGPKCKKALHDRDIVEFDHITPWAEGGRTEVSNGRALCADCHKRITKKTTLEKIDIVNKLNSGTF